MAYELSFDNKVLYDAGLPGITLPATLTYLKKTTPVFEAKIDTGSTHCIFQRPYADELEIDIKAGIPLPIKFGDTSLLVYGHDVLLTVSVPAYEFEIKLDIEAYFPIDDNLPRNLLKDVKGGLIE